MICHVNACIDKHDHKTFGELCHDVMSMPVDRHDHKAFEKLCNEHCVKSQLKRVKLIKALGN